MDFAARWAGEDPITLGGMSDPARGGLRLARLGAFVAACLGLAAAGHAVGGGEFPAATALALAAVPLTLLGLWFTRRERGMVALFGLLAGVEAGLHVAFHLAAHPLVLDPDAVALGLGRAGHSGYSGHLGAMPSPGAVDAAHALPAGVASTPMDLAALLPSPGMSAAHLVAIALTAIALGWGDRSLWAAARALWPQLPARALGRTPVAPASIRVATAPRRLSSLDLRRLAPVRGPPARRLAA